MDLGETVKLLTATVLGTGFLVSLGYTSFVIQNSVRQHKQESRLYELQETNPLFWPTGQPEVPNYFKILYRCLNPKNWD